MTVRPSFSCLKLLLGVLSLLCWLQPALKAIQPPDAADNPDTKQQATELKGVSAAELTAFTDSLAAKGLWLTELSTRMSRGNQVFDARAAPNTAELAWFAHVNLTAEQFAEKQKQYSADGFVLLSSKALTVRRQRLHLGLWTQDPQASFELQLPAEELPETGVTGTNLEPLNQLFRNLLKNDAVPGATVAVSRDGKMLFERGFGWASVDQKTPMQPDHEMRIASISKPLTAVAILLLEADGKLSLDDPILPILATHSAGFSPEQALGSDPRWADVQIRHLLQHTAGIDRDRSKDTMFELVRIAGTLELDRSPNTHEIVKYQLLQKLDAPPGTEFHYSNVGYCLLGRIIEAVTKSSCEEFVRQRILIPGGMTRTRLGRTTLEHRGTHEVFYTTRNRRRVPLVFDLIAPPADGIRFVEQPWGQWDLEVMDAHGGWVSTAGDLVRFAEMLSATENGLLQQKSLTLMLQRPALPEPSDSAVWYGLGWNVRELAEVRRFNIWHTGLLSGTSTLLVRRWDDYCWAVLFNCDRTNKNTPCSVAIDGPMHDAVDSSVQLLPR